MAEVVRTPSVSSGIALPNSPSESLSAFSNVDLGDETPTPSHRFGDYTGSRATDVEAGGIAACIAGPSGVYATAVNAEPLLAQVRSIDADVEELQYILIRVGNAVEQARAISDRHELEELASGVKKELDSALMVVKKSIKAQVSSMQQDTSGASKVPGCGVGTPTFHMRQTVANAVKRKLGRRRDNALDLESRLNMGIRDTAKRRYFDIMKSVPTDDLVDRLCSPAPPECKLGTLTRRDPEVNEKMASLLKEMEVRNSLAVETSQKLSALERELTFVVDLLEHEETAMEYEMSMEKASRRGMFTCICLAFVVFLCVVFVIPGLAIYL